MSLHLKTDHTPIASKSTGKAAIVSAVFLLTGTTQLFFMMLQRLKNY